MFTITANGTTQQVIVKNFEQNEIQNIMVSVNSNVPANFNLNYLPPEKINIVPTDPCGQSFSLSSTLLKKNIPDEYRDKIKSSYSAASSVKDEIQIPHGGVEIGYQMSLFDAISTGRASLKSKGEYFGDGVSITGDNTLPPPDDNTIKLKLNLEFYGPCDNDANEEKIVNDITDKWGALTTSDGKQILMEITSISHPGASSPPGTPGYNNIKLDCNQKASNCYGLGKPNSEDVIGGTWNPSDPPGTFAQMAGNLMGLGQQLDDWVKDPPTGDWVNLNDGTILSNTDFFNLVEAKWGGDFTGNLKPSDFENFEYFQVPRDGHENDPMANPFKSPLQSDIDKLAALAGLIIEINAGDVFSNPVDSRQNLLVIHSGDLFVEKGKKKTLNGIYIACLDQDRAQPNLSKIFNVAPSLYRWNGIKAVQYLLKLVKYIDLMKDYCGNLQPQYAIWRITDNYLTTSDEVNSLLESAGITIGNQIYDFPRLTNNAEFDTISQAVVPNELFFLIYNLELFNLK